MNVTSERHRPLRPKLDGADPLREAMVREIQVGPQHSILRQGDVPRAAHLVVEGQALRCRLLKDGRRQIIALMVAGDVCDLDAVMRGRADYSVEALISTLAN